MQKCKSNVLLPFFFIFFVCFFTSCKTLSLPKEPVDLFSLFDEGADVYVHIPVKGNESFIRRLVQALADDINNSDLNKILNRTESIAAAFFIDLTDTVSKNTVNFQLAARGNYPSLFINAALTKKNGWNTISEKASGTVYKRKKRSDNIELAFPDKAHIFISNRNLLCMQRNYDLYSLVPAPMLDWPSLADENGSVPLRSLMDDTAFISIYMPQAGSLLPKIVGSPVELAITYGIGTLKPYKDEYAIVSLKLQMSDRRSLLIAEKLFRFAVLGTDIIVKQGQGTILVLDNFVVLPASLIGLIRKK